MKLEPIITLALGFTLAAQTLRADPADDAYIREQLLKGFKPGTTPTPSLPDGDRHVAGIAQELNDVESAMILFKHCINQNRSNAETVNALNVLADNYDRLCAHLSQFYFWIKFWTRTSGNTSDFSPMAQEQLRELSNRINSVMGDEFKEVGDALEKKPRYAHDAAMFAVAQRMLVSANTLKALKAQADKQ
jgi:hypothetical protein